MLLGRGTPGLPSVDSNLRGVYESKIGSGGCDDGSGDSGIILSKSSIPLDQADLSDPSLLVEFFGGGISAACVRYQSSSSSFGEPATPNGCGDSALSHSPVSWQCPRHSYVCKSSSLAPLDENPSNDFVITRHSCEAKREETAPPYPFEAPHSAPILGSWGCDAKHGGGSELSYGLAKTANDWAAVTPLVATAMAEANEAKSHARFLEQQLRDKCIENMALARQLQDRDEELATIRAELKELRLQLRSQPHLHPPSGLQPGLLAQLQRAKEKLCSRRHASPMRVARQAAAARAAAAGLRPACDMAAPPSTPPPPAHPLSSTASLSAHPLSSAASLSGELSLTRVDTPQTPDALAPVARLISDAMAVLALPEELVTVTAPAAAHDEAESEAGTPAEAAAESDAPSLDAAVSVEPRPMAAAPPQTIRDPVVSERRRTDQAHAALLFSSRQAARLSEELAAVRAHAAALNEELRDWRRACLDNHKQLARLRRETPGAVAGSSGQQQA